MTSFGISKELVNNIGQNIVDKFSKLSKSKCFCEMS